jgi:hypothetical protein
MCYVRYVHMLSNMPSLSSATPKKTARLNPAQLPLPFSVLSPLAEMIRNIADQTNLLALNAAFCRSG